MSDVEKSLLSKIHKKNVLDSFTIYWISIEYLESVTHIAGLKFKGIV